MAGRYESSVERWLCAGSSAVQNCSVEVFQNYSFKQQDSGFIRTCQISMFERKKKNGEVIKRNWLCFSLTDGKLYCFFCKIFGTVKTQFTYGGFCDWKNAPQRLFDHETSKAHGNAVVLFEKRSQEYGNVEMAMTAQLEQEKEYWRKVLRRIVSVIYFYQRKRLVFSRK